MITWTAHRSTLTLQMNLNELYKLLTAEKMQPCNNKDLSQVPGLLYAMAH
jgi:hypothetical protein